jgi:hypothetical protein
MGLKPRCGSTHGGQIVSFGREFWGLHERQDCPTYNPIHALTICRAPRARLTHARYFLCVFTACPVVVSGHGYDCRGQSQLPRFEDGFDAAMHLHLLENLR